MANQLTQTEAQTTQGTDKPVQGTDKPAQSTDKPAQSETQTPKTPSTQEQLNTLLISMLQNENSAKVVELRQKLLERLAHEPDRSYTRVPGPKNITEVGGYYNLLRKLEREETLMRRQLLASILGLPYQGLDEK